MSLAGATAVLVERHEHLQEVARYVVLNRVRARMCAAADDWPLSSFGATVGETRCPRFLTVDRLLGVFGGSRERFSRFVADGSPAGVVRRAALRADVTGGAATRRGTSCTSCRCR